MSNADDIRKAFKSADAIMALEGYVRTPAMAETQAKIVSGRLTFDGAVQAAIKRAKERDDAGPKS